MSELADELERLATEIEPGPWRVTNSGGKAAWIMSPHPDLGSTGVCRMDWTRGPDSAANHAALIVALRNNLPAILSALREREEPCAECAAVSAAIGGADFMDPPDGGDVPLSEQVRRMRAALREREPVAWRWRANYADGTIGSWTYEAVPVQKRFYHGASVTMEVQPLYTGSALEHQEEQS